MLARLSFIGLITLADDHGLGRATPAFLMSRLHPYAPDVSGELFFQALHEIEASSLAFFYKSGDGCSYYVLPGWYEHQRVDHPSKTALPPPPPEILARISEYSRAFQEQYREEGKGEEGNGRERRGRDKGPKSTAPVVVPDDLKAWEADILNWIAYKAERKQSYKSGKGIEALWRSIRKIAPELRSVSIEFAMASNWAGIYEKKSGFQKTTTAGAAAPVEGKYAKHTR